MKKQFLQFTMLILSAAVLTLSSCKKDKVEELDNEVITTLQLTFVPSTGGTPLIYKFDSPAGPGGANTTTDLITLTASRSYNVTAQLLNKTKTPVEDVTLEVSAKSTSHRIYYQPSAGSNIVVSNLNNDPNGNPLGVTSTWTTGAAATGTIKVTLRHYPGTPPNKAAGDPVDSPKSSTDVEVQFDTKVQ